jgi:hypothetical protein
MESHYWMTLLTALAATLSAWLSAVPFADSQYGLIECITQSNGGVHHADHLVQSCRADQERSQASSQD